MKGKRRPSTAPPPHPPKPPPPPLRHRAWRAFAGLVAFAIACAGVAASAYQLLGGPPWPTDPDIDPAPPDTSPPFSVPFSVKNPSSLFDIQDAELICGIDRAVTDEDQSLTGVGLLSGAKNSIPALSVSPFKCVFPFRFSGKIIFAHMHVTVHYTYRLIWQYQAQKVIGPFTWDSTVTPPRWIKGKLLR